ncbi:MAG: hypothetical protein QW775_04510 [Ignisphaera sp.]|uniref:Uncharacterized protein n=1 Tax=Ignisphaera aggregans TaxID=334771 RepID=A0A7C4NJT2_9CREN
MVWITKREIAYYLILKHVFNNSIFNLGEALDILSLFGSKRTAKKIIRLLVSRGLIEKVDTLSYRVNELEPALFQNLKAYIVQRIHRRLKSVGLSSSIILKDHRETLAIRNCSNTLVSTFELLRGIIDIECG